MKKHFLLLVMALMSLTGWAQTATLGDVGVGIYTYGDDALPIPVVKDSEGAILTVTTHYTVSADAYDKTTNLAVNKQDMKGGQELYLKITGAGAYVGQEKKAYFTVQKKTLNITVATAFTRPYLGTVEPTIAAADWAAGAGELENAAPYSDTYAELGTLTYTYAGYGNPEYNGGEYDITFSGLSSDCYDIKYPAKKFTIVGTDLSGETVTVKAGTAFANKTYKGAKFTAAELTGLKLVYGTKELTQGTDFTIELNDADVYTLTADATVAAGKTYYTLAGGVYTAVAAPVDADIATYYELTTPQYINAGVCNYDVKFKGNYSGTKAHFGTFTIDPAPITVGMEDYEITYDNTDHKTTEYAGAVTFTYMGLVGADVANYATVTAGFTAPTKVQVGSTAKDASDYDLTISGGAASANYQFTTYLKGKLTIKPIELALKAKPAIKSVGEADPAFEIATDTPTGIIAGYKVSGVTFTRVGGEDVGSYDITPDWTAAKVKKDDDDQTKNYTFKAETPKATLTIGKGAITVTFKNASKFYGEADPTFNSSSYVVTGLQDGDELPAFTITREKAGTADGEKVGYYSISATITNPNAEKYTSVIVVPGALQIKKAQLTFTMPAQNLAIGKKASDLSKATITVDGIKNSDVAADLYNLSFNGVAIDGDQKTTTDQTLDDGIYATLTAAAQECYEVTGTNKVSATTASGKIIVGAGTASALAFTTAADDADYNLIKGHAGETQNVTIKLNNRVTRQVPAGTAHPWAAETWNTMVLPFEVTVEELSKQLGYAIVNVVNPEKTTEGNVVFKLEMQKIPANTPFCVKTSAAIPDAKVLTFTGKTIVDGGKYPSVDAGKGYKFVGAYKNLTIDKTTPDYYFLRGDNAKWANFGATSANSWTVVPFDAYIDQSATSGARELTVTFQEVDGSFTAIKSINADTMSMEPAKIGWYTIGVMKLQSAPTQKGGYIKDGKKVIVK